MHEGGGAVLAQDEATSAVWGMPGEGLRGRYRAGDAAAVGDCGQR